MDDGDAGGPEGIVDESIPAPPVRLIACVVVNFYDKSNAQGRPVARNDIDGFAPDLVECILPCMPVQAVFDLYDVRQAGLAHESIATGDDLLEHTL
jgi:hypothetical protein